ncbi:transcription elongation factor [Buchnera aphidicola (Cinara tujafilina)]|uniref:Transcription elongation factor GreA n=1 Tax=Buchnera aphidicola (Cinara tujafilina) TaxID=261317 RepID=F7WZG9_9GAMM|nr:transcription elongation factor GreA [Buchnera aphidicola]AEH39831.1 transcription elongation factor [Buchnera aphidicola (Cinara tujafilina)]
MTLKGFNKLKKELKKLKNIIRPSIINAIAEARQLGDLKENAEYHAAREEQSFCENKIRRIETTLSRAQVINVKKILFRNVVIFGATVTILQTCTDNIFKYTIVGDDEANLKENSISIYSPMSRGLIGKKNGDIVKIKTPSGLIQYLIIKIEYI